MLKHLHYKVDMVRSIHKEKGMVLLIISLLIQKGQLDKTTLSPLCQVYF